VQKRNGAADQTPEPRVWSAAPHWDRFKFYFQP
jgi:hypothetical protein